MARRSKPNANPEELQKELFELLTNFSEELKKSDLRSKVVALVPAFHTLRDLGSSLIPKSEAPSARDRIIEYLKQYPQTIIDGDELMVVSGINEWARRVRELRVQFGWWIYSGVTFKQMAQNPEDAASFERLGIDPAKIKPDQYVLMSTMQDRDAAHRWNLLNDIRKEKTAKQGGTQWEHHPAKTVEITAFFTLNPAVFSALNLWHSRGQRFDPAYLHQTNHKVEALWFEFFSEN